ncbi:hypothetical protein EAG_01424, partial [Camponotus floridanus]
KSRIKTILITFFVGMIKKEFVLLRTIINLILQDSQKVASRISRV